MEIKTFSDLPLCEKLWKKFSMNQTLWDDWDIIFSMYNKKLYDPYFLVLVDEGKEIGLLPLMIEKDTGDSFFFGGTFPEARRLWFRPEHFKLFFDNLPPTTKLFDLHGKDARSMIEANPEYEKYFSGIDHRYYISLEELNNDFKNYTDARFSKDRRKNFRNDMKKADALGIEVEWGNETMHEIFMEFNKKRFGSESDFLEDENIDEIRNLTSKLKEKNLLHTILIRIKGKIEAVSMCAFYKGVFHVMYATSNREINNLGKKMHVLNIEKAMGLGAKEVNYMVGDNTWKAFWKMDKEECISFIKDGSIKE